MSKCKCKECVHNEVCEESTPYGEHDCEDFKSKSLFVEIPCQELLKNVFVLQPNGAIYSVYIIEIRASDGSKFQKGFHFIYKLGWKKAYTSNCFGFCCADDFGKTVFLTKEEAEKKLKEVQK